MLYTVSSEEPGGTCHTQRILIFDSCKSSKTEAQCRPKESVDQDQHSKNEDEYSIKSVGSLTLSSHSPLFFLVYLPSDECARTWNLSSMYAEKLSTRG